MLDLSRDGSIANLVIDRPGKKNAISQAMWIRLADLIAEAESDPMVRVLVVSGRGDCFAAGADISEFEAVYATRATAEAYMADMARAQTALMRCAKPTVAMIRGACIGAGCGLALACDLRFADPTARFGITPAKLGMIYSLADSRRLVDAVGLASAYDLLLSGRIVDAEEAARLGILNRLVPSEALAETTRDFAELLAANAPGALKGVKQILSAIRAGARDDDAETRTLFLDILEQPEFAEGRRAFREKRPPRF
jgi:enoyl-CoA hydratase/carnithine racemase